MSYFTLFQSSDLAKKVVPLTIPLGVYDARIGPNGITWSRECLNLFKFSSANEQNDAIDDAVSITWQQCWD